MRYRARSSSAVSAPTTAPFTSRSARGATRFAGADRFTITAGAGARVLIRDWLAVHLDMRDHIMDVDVLGANKSTHNYEATLGLTAFF